METLSHKQEQAVNLIVEWYNSDQQCFVLGGYAGTGKTTILKHLHHIIKKPLYAAYTGKAASVMKEKGLNASTIHSLIYEYIGKDKEGKMLWGLKDGEFDMLIVDEYSMLTRSIVEDLQAKFDKILFVGDPGQLPPIGESEQILKPDFFLTEIHRQAENSPIVLWSAKVRNGELPPIGTDEPGFLCTTQGKIDPRNLYTSVDQIICARNDTRRQINDFTRKLIWGEDVNPLPVRGDKMICLRNNPKAGLFNGLIAPAQSNAKRVDDYFTLKINGQTFKVWDCDVLGLPDKYSYYSKLERFDYGYALTAHKSQGSEFDSVLIYDESWSSIKIPWLYTAITRAKQDCILIRE